MLAIRYKSPKHSLQAMQEEKEASPKAHSKTAGINHLLDVLFFCLSVDNTESRDNLLSLSDEYRQMRSHPTTPFVTVLF